MRDDHGELMNKEPVEEILPGGTEVISSFRHGIPSGFWTTVNEHDLLHDYNQPAMDGVKAGTEAIYFNGWSGHVSQDTLGGGHLKANRNGHIGKWEKFFVEDNDDETISIKSWNGNYLTCGSSSNDAVTAVMSAKGDD